MIIVDLSMDNSHKCYHNHNSTNLSRLNSTIRHYTIKIKLLINSEFQQKTIYINYITKTLYNHCQKNSQQPEQQPISSIGIFINLIIWIGYVLGSIQTQSTRLSTLNIVDIIANVIAVLYLIISVIKNMALRQFDEILHLYSLVLTAGFLFYQIGSANDDIFIKGLLIARTFRVLFPFFIIEKFYNVFIKPAKIINLSKKTIFTVILFLILSGLLGYQLYADSQGNRCRKQMYPVVLSDESSHQWITVDKQLCGSRDCPVNSYCRNPKQIGIKINQEQILKQNLYNFDSSWRSAISMFFMYTGNSWGEISSKYFNAFTSWFTVPFYILGYFLYLILMLSLITIFFDKKKSQKDRLFMINQKQFKNKVIKDPKLSKNTLKSLKQKQKNIAFQQIQSVNQIEQGKNIQQSARKIKQDKTKQKQVKFAEQKPQKQQKPQQQTKWKSIVFYFIVAILTILHIILASQFSLDPLNIDNDLYNRKVGIIMCIFFIIQFFLLAFLVYELLGFSQKQQSPIQQNQQNLQQDNKSNNHKSHHNLSEKQLTFTIFYLQGVIFLTQLFDYMLRMGQDNYLFEQSSSLTTLSHYCLALRLYYVFIILAYTNNERYLFIKAHLITCIKSFSSVIKYFMIIIIIPCFLGIISYINQQDLSKNVHNQSINNLFSYINSYMLLQLKYDSIFTIITGVIWIILFQFVIVKFIMSNVILQSCECYYHLSKSQRNQKKQKLQDIFGSKTSLKLKNSSLMHRSLKTYKDCEQQVKDLTKQQQQKVIKSQNSFYIFSFQNCIRNKLFLLLNDNYYHQNIKIRFLYVYLLANVVVFIIGKHDVYQIVTTVLEVFLIVDVVINSIAFRFFGKYSFTNNQILNLCYVGSMVLVLIWVWTQVWYQIVIILQFSRVFIVFNSFQSFKSNILFIRQHIPVILTHYMILIPLAIGGTLLTLINLSNQSQHFSSSSQQSQRLQLSFMPKLLISLKLSLSILCQKGNYHHIIESLTNNNTKIDELSLFIQKCLSYIFNLTFIYSLVGIFICGMRKQQQLKDKQKLVQLKHKSIVEHYKIKQKIFSIKPQFDYKIYGSGFFKLFCQSMLFTILKRSSCMLSIICFIILNTQLSNHSRISIFSIHLFLLLIQISCFICQSIAYSSNQPNFILNTILFILSIPGAFIGFINPIQYSTQPIQLKYILVGFNFFMIFRLFNVAEGVKWCRNMVKYVKSRFNHTLKVFGLLIVFVLGYGLYMYQLFKHHISILQCLNYVFVGLIGGDFINNIQQFKHKHHHLLSSSFQFSQHMLLFFIHLTYIFLTPYIISSSLYQLSQNLKQQLPSSNIEYSCYNFNQYFHQNRFIQQWKKLDPYSRGCVNYRELLYKNHIFIQCFSITKVPYKLLINRIETFMKLVLPIYQIQIKVQSQDQNNTKTQINKQYVVLFYDFLYAMTKFAINQMNSQRLTYENKCFIQNMAVLSRPVSIIDIKNQNKAKNLIQIIEQQKQIYTQFYENLKKQTYSKTKQIMKQQAEANQSIGIIDLPLRTTKYTSENIYYGHRLRNKIIKFIKHVKMQNQIKKQAKVG